MQLLFIYWVFIYTPNSECVAGASFGESYTEYKLMNFFMSIYKSTNLPCFLTTVAECSKNIHMFIFIGLLWNLVVILFQLSSGKLR